MTRITRTIDPAEHPVTLAEVKAHLRIDFDDEDALLEIYTASATAYLDGPNGILGRTLITQTWSVRERSSVFVGGRTVLPFFNVSAVGVSYLDSEGDWIEVPGVSVQFAESSSGLGTDVSVELDAELQLHPTETHPFLFTVTTGQSRAAIRPVVKAALFLIIGDLYRDREASSMREIRPNSSVGALLVNERRKLALRYVER